MNGTRGSKDPCDMCLFFICSLTKLSKTNLCPPPFIADTYIRVTVPWIVSAWFSRCIRCTILTSQIWQSICFPISNLFTWCLKKCLLNEPTVAYSFTLSSIGNRGLPRYKKHTFSLLSVLTDAIACPRAMFEADCTCTLALALVETTLSAGRDRSVVR